MSHLVLADAPAFGITWRMLKQSKCILENEWRSLLHCCNFVDYGERCVCIKRLAAQWCPGRPSVQSFLSLDAFTWASLQLLSQALRAPLQMRRDGERWKPWERWAVGHRLQKLHGNFKGFLFLTPGSLWSIQRWAREWFLKVGLWKRRNYKNPTI